MTTRRKSHSRKYRTLRNRKHHTLRNRKHRTRRSTSRSRRSQRRGGAGSSLNPNAKPYSSKLRRHAPAFVPAVRRNAPSLTEMRQQPNMLVELRVPRS